MLPLSDFSAFKITTFSKTPPDGLGVGILLLTWKHTPQRSLWDEAHEGG